MERWESGDSKWLSRAGFLGGKFHNVPSRVIYTFGGPPKKRYKYSSNLFGAPEVTVENPMYIPTPHGSQGSPKRVSRGTSYSRSKERSRGRSGAPTDVTMGGSSFLYMPRQTGSAAGVVRKFKKLKKGAFKKENKTSLYGYQLVNEASSLVSDPDCVLVGHTSVAPYSLCKVLAGTLLRKLFKKAEYAIKGVNETLAEFVAPGLPGTNLSQKYLYVKTKVIGLRDTAIYYRPIDVGTTFAALQTDLTTFIFALASGDVTSGSAWSSTLGGGAINLVLDNSEFMEYGFITPFIYSINPGPPVSGNPGTADVIKIDLQNTKVYVWSQSTLKAANQTDTDGTSEDINAVPLIGRQYFGKGQVPVFRGWYKDSNSTVPNFQSDVNSGRITAAAEDDAEGLLKEPPPPKAFQGVSYAGGVQIQPGEIKLSTLKFKKTMFVNSWLKFIGAAARGNTQPGAVSIANDPFFYSNRHLGNYKLFALERVIRTLNVDQRIAVRWEIQLNMGGIATTSSKNYMNRDYTQFGDGP